MAVFTGRRIRDNNVFGTTTNNPLTNSGTTLNSAALANLSAVAPNHAVLVLDPLRSAGAPEIVIVTAHTGAATSATITRGAYGTVARQHASGTLWVLATTKDDLIEILTADPTDVYAGQVWYRSDLGRYRMHDGTAAREFHNPPTCRVYNSAAISTTSGSWTTLTFNSERFDSDSMHSTSSNTSRITFNTAGVYLLTGHCEIAANATGHRGIRILSGGLELGTLFTNNNGASFNTVMSVSAVYKFAAGAYAELNAFQNSGSALNVPASPALSPEFSATWVGVG